jgi:EAL domain-containing protein (putative c-di-GMP-specific phosphodiesterase class I)
MIEGCTVSGSTSIAPLDVPDPVVRLGLPAGEPRASPVPLTDIRTALASAMIEMRYQPVVRLADRGVVGLEALARLNHPARGTVLPEDFVPQIEDAGLGGQLTELVVACAFADMTGAALAPLGLSVSLNFPLDVLVRTSALTWLDLQRRAALIPVEHVIIELTESQPVRDLPALRGAIEHLRRDGYQIVIDDVGPAVAGLDRLLDLPFTGIKLDRTLMRQFGTVPEVVAEVQRIIAEAKARGLTVVAEGIEDVAVWHRLREFGADQAQGFLVAHPLPAAAVPTWLESWRDLPAF